MKFIGGSVMLAFAIALAFPFCVKAQERKYGNDDIKRILYLKERPANGRNSFVVLKRVINRSKLECIYFGTSQTVTLSPEDVIALDYFEDSSNFTITQYAIYFIFERRTPNLPFELAKINNDSTGRMNMLSVYINSVDNLKSSINFIRQSTRPQTDEQVEALADLIKNDNTLAQIKQAAANNDWMLAVALYDNYKETVLTLYKRSFRYYPDILQDVQTACQDCEKDLISNFANKMRNPNMRRNLFKQHFPHARGLWSRTAPSSYRELRNIFIESMKSYHDLDNISKLFQPQDWGSAMLDTLLLVEGAPCAAELEKEFDDEMRRLNRKTRQQ